MSCVCGKQLGLWDGGWEAASSTDCDVLCVLECKLDDLGHLPAAHIVHDQSRTCGRALQRLYGAGQSCYMILYIYTR